MRTPDAEVLVVGAGPAGAATAALLARRGRDVLVLDRSAFPREKPCAEYLSPGVVDVLARLGVLDEVLACGAARPLGMRLFTPRETLLFSYPDDGRRRTALAVRRPVLDDVLLEAARAAGARVHERVQVRGALLEDARVVGVRAVGREGEQQVRARFVVAADGLRSAVARALRLERPVRWPRRLGLVARYAGARIDAFGEMHVAGRSYCGLAPVGSGLVTAGLVVPLDAKPAGEPLERFFERSLAELPGIARALAASRRVTPIRGAAPLARSVRGVAGPGYLLVGDAAGFRDPFTGEGVYRAIRGAELAAEAVERALARPDVFAEGYERARREAFAAKERVCLLVQAFLASAPAFDYALARLRARPDAAAVLAAVLGDYRDPGEALRPSYVWRALRP